MVKVSKGIVGKRSNANDAGARMQQDATIRGDSSGDCNADACISLILVS
jgi:hypothetical protein